MRFKKGLIMFLAVMLAFVGFTAPASAQNLDYLEYLTRFLEGQAVARVRGVDDTDVAIVVDYYQASAHTFAKVAVEADGNLTFTQDASDGTTASTELECPVDGDLGGIIDVSDGDCDTFGEVVDIINASTSWRAVLVGALRTDTWDANSLLADPADFDAQRVKGDLLYWDTDAIFIASWVVSEKQDFTSFYGAGNRLLSNPWESVRPVVRYLLENTDYDSGTSFVYFYSVKPNNRAGTEEVTTIYQITGGTDAADKTIVDFTFFGGILGRKGEKLIVRIENSAEMTASAASIIRGYGTEFASR